MSRNLGRHPEPPHDLSSLSPVFRKFVKGDALYRLCGASYSPLFFGKTGTGRFDAPDNSYGVMYAGLDVYACFIETFGHKTGVKFVTTHALNARALHRLTLVRDLSVVDLSGAGLASLGADARLISGSNPLAQRWGAALRGCSPTPDGIIYPARHDLSKLALALFEHTSNAFTTVSLGSLLDPPNQSQLAEILKAYKFGLVD